MRLSVIVPVYKTEYNLRKCLNSIISQEVKDLEIILINDGSPDNADLICKEYADKYPFIKYQFQTNAGLSAARNRALEMATGDYVTFVDSDDHIGKHTYAKLMEILEKHPEYDVLEFPIYIGVRRKPKLLSFEEREYRQMREYWIKTRAYSHCYVCNKIFRHTLFGRNRFAVGKVFEDALIYPPILEETMVLRTTNIGLYYYNYNSESITANVTVENLKTLFYAQVPLLGKWGCSDFYERMLKLQIRIFMLTGEEPELPIMPYKETTRQRLVHLIGLRKTCVLYKYKKISSIRARRLLKKLG